MIKMLGLSTEWLDAITSFSLFKVVFVFYAEGKYTKHQSLVWMD